MSLTKEQISKILGESFARHEGKPAAWGLYRFVNSLFEVFIHTVLGEYVKIVRGGSGPGSRMDRAYTIWLTKEEFEGDYHFIAEIK